MAGGLVYKVKQVWYNVNHKSVSAQYNYVGWRCQSACNSHDRRWTLDYLTDMPASHLNLLRTVDVRQKSQTEPVTARWVSEAIDCQRRQWCMKRLTNTTVQLIVSNAAPVRRLHVHHRLHGRRNWWRWHFCHQHMSWPLSVRYSLYIFNFIPLITTSNLQYYNLKCYQST